MSTVPPAADMSMKVCTIPSTVPRKPIIGAPPAIVASEGSPFSSFDTSRLATFSMADCTSLIGRPSRSMPFSIMRAIGVSVLRQRSTAAAILPSRMKSRMRFMKFMSSVEALRIARNRSTKMKIVTPPRISSGHISQPPLVNNSHKPIRASSVAATSAACKNVIITYAKLFI